LETFTDILQPLLLFIAVTFLVVEVVKRAVQAVGVLLGRKWALGKASILVAIFLGIAEAYFWWLTVLPDPRMPGGEWFAIVIAGFLIAGAAGGLFTWLKNLFPWFEQMGG